MLQRDRFRAELDIHTALREVVAEDVLGDVLAHRLAVLRGAYSDEYSRSEIMHTCKANLGAIRRPLKLFVHRPGAGRLRGVGELVGAS